MSFLAPLYIAGIAAVSLPILFHLIRRIPQGRVPFSSLMFLRPSPPRLARRSKLEHIVLLLLRATALTLLALAFARPFLREAQLLGGQDAATRWLAVMVDTSASMRRDDLWSQAVRRVNGVMGEVKPGDRVALFTFDHDVRRLVDFQQWGELPPKRRAAFVQSRLRSVRPSWGATALGDALVHVADTLDDASDETETSSLRQIVLISDMQQGSETAALQAYQWPDEMRIDVRPVTASQTTNAALHLVQGGEGFPDEAAQGRLRVRVTNSADAVAESFNLHWMDADGNRTSAAESVYVPAGQSRVILAPKPPHDINVDRLTLSGDAHQFDNTLYMVPLVQQVVTIGYLGRDAADDDEGLRFYLERAFSEMPWQRVVIAARSPDEPLTPEELASMRMVVAGDAVPATVSAGLKRYVAQGGTLLYVLKDSSAAESLGRIVDGLKLQVDEAPVRDYAMLGEIAFDDPLFAPFATPQYSDFTNIRFWRHRRVTLADATDVRVLARFDSGEPALFRQHIGQGRVYVLTSGWNPADSQFAAAGAKFVPLLTLMVQSDGRHEHLLPQHEVHQPVRLAAPHEPGSRMAVTRPDGSEVAIRGDLAKFDATDLPGVYVARSDEGEQRFAVNLATAESRTAPLATDEMEQLGIELGTAESAADEALRRRQMRDIELEGRQKVWRWLVLAALVVLIAETGLAGRIANAKMKTAGA